MKKLWYCLLIIGIMLIGFHLKNTVMNISTIQHDGVVLSTSTTNELNSKQKENIRRYLHQSSKNNRGKKYNP